MTFTTGSGGGSSSIGGSSDVALSSPTTGNTLGYDGTVQKWINVTSSAHVHTAAQISNASSIGRLVLTAATVSDALNAIDAAASEHQHSANDVVDLHTVATTGQYDDLIGRPELSMQFILAVNGVYPIRDTDSQAAHFYGVNAPGYGAGQARPNDLWTKTLSDFTAAP